jgi:hypothetical protein
LFFNLNLFYNHGCSPQSKPSCGAYSPLRGIKIFPDIYRVLSNDEIKIADSAGEKIQAVPTPDLQLL